VTFDPVDFPMTDDERALFTEWNALVADVRKKNPSLQEMADLCGALARSSAATARAIKVAYGQPLNRNVAREVVVLEAAERLLIRIAGNLKGWSWEVRNVIDG
jgi:hypothetical protein